MLKHTLFLGTAGWLLSTISNTPGFSEKCHFHEKMIVDPGQSPRKMNDRQERFGLLSCMYWNKEEMEMSPVC